METVKEEGMSEDKGGRGQMDQQGSTEGFQGRKNTLWDILMHWSKPIKRTNQLIDLDINSYSASPGPSDVATSVLP